MGTTIDSIWNKAQRLSLADRLILTKRLQDSLHETEDIRRKRVASEIDKFFGGWNRDSRTTQEIMNQIREGRTDNSFPKGL